MTLHLKRGFDRDLLRDVLLGLKATRAVRPSGCQPTSFCDEAVDMRKSFEGLSALVEAAFPGKLLTGALFLFPNRRRPLIKILNWEGDGFTIWYKRLEQGTFPECFQACRQLSRQQVVMLLDGIDRIIGQPPGRRMAQRWLSRKLWSVDGYSERHNNCGFFYDEKGVDGTTIDSEGKQIG